MRKSIYLLLTLLTISTSYSKEPASSKEDKCFEVSEAYYAKGSLLSLAEGYLVIEDPKKRGNLMMVDVPSYAKRVIKAYRDVTGSDEKNLEYRRSKSNKAIYVCFNDVEFEDGKIVMLLESYDNFIKIKNRKN